MVLLPGRVSVIKRGLRFDNAIPLADKLLECVPGLLFVTVSVHNQENLTITFKVSSDFCNQEWFTSFARRVRYFMGGTVVEQTIDESVVIPIEGE